jgi:hypothetical protein
MVNIGDIFNDGNNGYIFTILDIKDSHVIIGWLNRGIIKTTTYDLWMVNYFFEQDIWKLDIKSVRKKKLKTINAL